MGALKNKWSKKMSAPPFLGSQGKSKSADERGVRAVRTALHGVRHRTESGRWQLLHLSGTAGKRSVNVNSF